MKRYLLIIMMMVCAVTGAWAADATVTGGNDALVTITTNGDADLNALTTSTALSGNWGCNTLSNNGIKVIGAISQTGLGVINSMMSQNSQMYYDPNKFLDLSEASFSGDITSLPAGTSTAEYPTNIKFASCTLPAGSDIPATIPTGYQYVYSPCTSGGTIRIYVTEANVTIPHFTSEQIAAASQIVVTGSAKDAFIATMSADAKEKLPFDGSIAITTTSTDNVQAKVEAYLINKGLISNESTAEDKTAVLAQITSLTIAGPLTSADITYLSNLTSLEILDLTQVSSFGTGVSKATINSAVASGATVTYPALFYSSAGGVTTITVLTPGGVTQAALTAAGFPTTGISDTTLKIVGTVTSADITAINEHGNSGWATRRIDLSQAVVSDNIPRISGGNAGGDNVVSPSPHYIILPPGTTAPTAAEVAYNSDNERVTTNGIYNGYGELKYIIIPASENGGHAKIFVNKDKYGNIPTSIETSDISLIANINNPSVIDVYNLNNAFGHANYSTLQASINALTATDAAWEGKAIVYHATMNPMVITGCNVTIDMNEANGKSLATLISEANTEVVKTSTGICSLTINGPLASADIAALNTAMGTGKELASIESLNLGGATGMAQTDVDALAIPETLTRLTIPADRIVDGNLVTAAEACGNLYYIYSPSSDAQRLGADKESQYDGTKNYSPDYAWIVKQGGLATAFANEEPLRNSFYIKVASSVALISTDVDFDGMGVNKPTNYLFLDFSGSNLTPAVAAQYKVTDDIGYRIILPNNWTGDQMAVFAANEHCGSLAAVYSYNGTVLNIMEIDDLSYNTSALSNPRIMRSGTTEVDVISGFYNGVTYSQFGGNLLAALNQMGDPANTVGPSVKTIVIETGINVPSAITFTNPSVKTIKLLGLSTYSGVNVNGCTSLNTLDLKGSAVSSVTASGLSTLTTVDLTTSVIYGAADFSGSGITTLTTTDETNFNSTLNLTNTKLTSFATAARVVGDISLNGTTTLSSINVTAATFVNTTSMIHIDESTTEDASNEEIIANLKQSGQKTILLPSGFDAANRIHPYTEAVPYIEITAPVVAAVTYAASDMVFHDAEATGGTPDKFRYWYQGTMTDNQIATVGTSTKRTLNDVIAGNTTEGYTCDAHADLTNDTHVMIKVVGTMKANDLDSLKYLNATAIDLSDAVIEEGVLAARLKNANILNANTKFLILPDTCSREHILNEATLSKQTGVYSVIAINTTDEGRDLTSWSQVSGALQPAVVIAGNRSCQSWTKTPDGETNRKIYTSDISNFKKLKISGLINSYDLSKGDQKLDADGHLAWKEDVVESTDQTRTLIEDDADNNKYAYNVYGPFSACHLLTEIDLRDAYFEPWSNQQTGVGYFTRYWVSDMTLSALNVISTATYKVVIPQDSRVNEVPADFMRCSTNIRAICIPSNIRVIRTRAFYTIDYVWTTSASGLGMEGNDPEGSNTRLDNGASLSVDGGTTFVETSALVYNKQTHKYEENPAFLDSYYTANYGTENGGGTYTFGSNLRLIETAAFANTQPNVKDVYVLNTTAPECHVDAFNTVMYTGNGGYNSAKVDSEGIITRDAYYNGRWITMLHYPRQTTTPNVQRYTDPTREYSIATGERDGKGAILYFPNQSEFIRAYQQGTYGYIWNAWNPTRQYGSVNNGDLTNTTSGWSAENQTTANGLFDAYTTGGTNHQYTSFAGVNDSTSVTKTTTTLVPYYQVQYGSGSYSTAETQGNLYPKSEILAGRDVDNSGEPTAKDYRGWHQFVLNAYAANTVLEEEPYRSYITDNEWWTICPEFDITLSESALLFGKVHDITTDGVTEYPSVHKLKYVRRTYSDGVIHLCFTKDLATYKENRTNAKVTYTIDGDKITGVSAFADQHGTVSGTTGVIEVSGAPSADDVIMSAGVPYLIKPNLPENAKRQYIIFKSGADAANYNNNKSEDDPIGVGDESLYYKIKYSQDLSGDAQRAMIKSGTYTVPVFVLDYSGSKYTMENVEENTFSPDDDETKYYRSTDRHYTFVGTFYKSFLPYYCYFLGWDSQNKCAKFYYHNNTNESATINNEMHWANGTGVIVPTLADDLEGSPLAFKHQVARATDTAHPAQWILKTEFADDSFVTAGNSAPRVYVMDIDSPDMQATAIMNVNTDENMNVNKDEVSVYTLDGRKVANSLQGLSQGIYIVNGKKYVVK